MRLTTPERVMQSMGVQSGTGQIASARQALDNATAILGGLLETDFAFGTFTDYFDIPPFSRGSTHRAVFRLTNALVSSSPLSVRTSKYYERLVTPNDGTVLDPTSYSFDSAKGAVSLIDDLPAVKGGICITYKSGFRTGGIDEDTYDGVPDWLQQAAVTAAVLMIQSHALTAAHTKSASVKQAVDSVRRHLSLVLSNRLRPRAVAEYPIRTERHTTWPVT